jgi:hypothetical protein
MGRSTAYVLPHARRAIREAAPLGINLPVNHGPVEGSRLGGVRGGNAHVGDAVRSEYGAFVGHRRRCRSLLQAP